MNYDVTPNPQFQNGTKSQSLLTNEFMMCWDSSDIDCVVSEAEFMDYYMDVSPSIISDDVFANMVKHTWNC